MNYFQYKELLTVMHTRNLSKQGLINKRYRIISCHEVIILNSFGNYPDDMKLSLMGDRNKEDLSRISPGIKHKE
ncbi:MAG: hypothetical protein ABI168_07785 [Ginsengibacter sp.]